MTPTSPPAPDPVPDEPVPVVTVASLRAALDRAAPGAEALRKALDRAAIPPPEAWSLRLR